MCPRTGARKPRPPRSRAGGVFIRSRTRRGLAARSRQSKDETNGLGRVMVSSVIRPKSKIYPTVQPKKKRRPRFSCRNPQPEKRGHSLFKGDAAQRERHPARKLLVLRAQEVLHHLDGREGRDRHIDEDRVPASHRAVPQPRKLLGPPISTR